MTRDKGLGLERSVAKNNFDINDLLVQVLEPSVPTCILLRIMDLSLSSQFAFSIVWTEK